MEVVPQTRFPTPLFDGIIILPDPQKEETGGVLIPEEIRDKPLTGTVAAIGKGRQAEQNAEWIEMQVQEGDRVLYRRFVGAPISVNDVEYILLTQNDLLLII